jgi:hypothetical protein
MYIGINTDHKAHAIKQKPGEKESCKKNKKFKQDMMCRRLIAIITSLV